MAASRRQPRPSFTRNCRCIFSCTWPLTERLQGEEEQAERRLRGLSQLAQNAGGQLLGAIAQMQLTGLLHDAGREREAQQQLRSALQARSRGWLAALFMSC